MTPPTTRPRLSPRAITALNAFGLTPQQVQAVSRRLASIARALEPRVPKRDVRDILVTVAESARAMVGVVDHAESGRLAAYRVALGQLQLAAAQTPGEPNDGSGLGVLPESPDFPALARLLDCVARAALANGPGSQSRGRRDPGQAVALLLSALAEPSDPTSRALARRAGSPTPIASKANPFAAIAEVVFREATRAESADVRAAIDAWRKRREAEGLKPATKSRVRRPVKAPPPQP